MTDASVMRQGAFRWGVLAATALGALLRFAWLGRQSFWIDEFIWTQTASMRSLRNIIHQPDGYPPGIPLLFHLLQHLGWGSDVALRAPSALAGTLAIPVAALVARRFVGRDGALAVAALLAVNPFAVWYAQEAGAYACGLLFVLLGVLFLLRLFEDGGPGSAAGWAAACGAGFAVHYYTLLSVLAQAPFLWLEARRRPRRRRLLIASAVLGALALAALLPLFLHDVVDITGSGHPREIRLLALPYTAQVLAGGFAIGPPVRAMHEAIRTGGTPWSAIAHALVLPILAICLVATLAILGCLAPWKGRLGLVLALALAPILGPWLNSLNGVPYRPRYALFGLPFVLILCAAGLGTRHRRIVLALLVLLGGLGIAGIVRSQEPANVREDTRDAAARVAAAGGGDVVLVGEGADPFMRYATKVGRIVDLHAGDAADPDRLERRLAPLLCGPGDLWIVSSRAWTEDPDGRALAYIEGRLTPEGTTRFPGVILHRFRRRPC